MPLTRVTVNGYEELKKTLASAKGVVFVLFTGSKDASGKSWCPDCVVGSIFFLLLLPRPVL